jgi:putative oxidoreductase
MLMVPSRFTDTAYFLLRFVAGFMFALHGAQKLFGVLGGKVVTGDSLMLVAGVIELVAGILIAAGLFARVAGILASGEMAAAYLKAHLPQGPWPIQNGGELALLYCFLFLFVAAYGAGVYSLDAALRHREPVRVTA